MKKIQLLIIIAFMLTSPLSTQALISDEFYNAGFVNGIWYSTLPFFSGQTIRVYTAFQNHSGGDIEGTVEFFDNGRSIGQANFSAINNRLIESWIDWQVSYGDHIISAKIIKVKRSEAGQSAQEIKIANIEYKSETVFADNDTDQDGIGDLLDTVTAPITPPLIVSDNTSPIVQKMLSIINDYAGQVAVKKQSIEAGIKNIDDIRQLIDTNHDGVIDILDFNILMVNWGQKGANIVDYNKDEIVDIIDFNMLMIYWS
jgi:hypothetical protein